MACTLRAMALFLLLFLPGCIVGPDFRRPKVVEFQPHFLESHPDESIEDIALATWWTNFGDPILDELICQACVQNPSLREAYYRIVEARAQVGVARSGFLPKLDGNASHSFQQASVNASQFGGGLTNRSDIYTTGFDSTWEIDLFGKIRRSLESSCAQMRALDQAYRYVKITLLADIATSYVDYRVIQQRIEIAERNLSAQRQTLDTVERRHQSGLVGPLDVAQAESNVHTTAASIPPLREELRITRNRISTLIGCTPYDGLSGFLDIGPIPMPAGGMAVGMPCQLLTRRPDIRQAEFEVATASAEIGVAMADLYPQLTILGDIGVSSRPFSELFSENSMSFSIGPSLRWKILHFGRIMQNVDAKRAALSGRIAAYQQSVLHAVEEVENGLVSYHEQANREVALRKAVEATARSVEFSRARYDSGLISFQPFWIRNEPACKAKQNLRKRSVPCH